MPTATEKFVNWITGMPIALFDAVGSVFNPSGPNHTIGLVPDPGATPGTGNFLREDGTWAIPPGTTADMVQARIKGRASGAGTGPPQDLTGTQVAVIVDAFTGDSGAGGLKGEVPAPAAGDGALFKSLSADGTFKSNLPLLASGANTNQAQLDIVLSSFTSFIGFKLFIFLLPLTDGVDLQLRFSQDGGATFLATNYGYAHIAIADDASFAAGIVSASTAQILLNASIVNRQVGNQATEGWKGCFELFNNFDITLWQSIQMVPSQYVSNNATPVTYSVSGQGTQKTAGLVNALRFFASSGNITYKYRLYGVA